MAYDEALAERVRDLVGPHADMGEIKMFGGLCFTVNGNMFAGIVGDDLMVRVGPEQHEAALRRPGARIMDFAKRPMVGFVYVDRTGTKTKASLEGWLKRALAYVESLPPKAPKKKKPPAKRAR